MPAQKKRGQKRPTKKPVAKVTANAQQVAKALMRELGPLLALRGFTLPETVVSAEVPEGKSMVVPAISQQEARVTAEVTKDLDKGLRKTPAWIITLTDGNQNHAPVRQVFYTGKHPSEHNDWYKTKNMLEGQKRYRLHFQEVGVLSLEGLHTFLEPFVRRAQREAAPTVSL